VVVVLLLAVAYGLNQCADTSDTATLTALKTDLAQAKASANGAATGATAVANPGTPATAAQQAELKQVIAQAINIYVAQDYGGMATLTDPELIKNLSASGQPALTTGEYAKVLSQRPDAPTTIAQTLQALLYIQDETPAISADGTRAVYSLNRPVGKISQMVFKKVGGTWYMD